MDSKLILIHLHTRLDKTFLFPAVFSGFRPEWSGALQLILKAKTDLYFILLEMK